jgi:hypothetical protein
VVLTLTELSDTVGKELSGVNVTPLIYRDATHGRESSHGTTGTVPHVQEAPMAVVFAHAIVRQVIDKDVALSVDRHACSRVYKFIIPTSLPFG